MQEHTLCPVCFLVQLWLQHLPSTSSLQLEQSVPICSFSKSPAAGLSVLCRATSTSWPVPASEARGRTRGDPPAGFNSSFPCLPSPGVAAAPRSCFLCDTFMFSCCLLSFFFLTQFTILYTNSFCEKSWCGFCPLTGLCDTRGLWRQTDTAPSSPVQELWDL